MYVSFRVFQVYMCCIGDKLAWSQLSRQNSIPIFFSNKICNYNMLVLVLVDQVL